MKKYYVVIAAVLMFMMFSICGCAAGDNELYSKDNPVTISIWTYYNGDQLEAFNSLVKEFNESVGAQKGIYVESYSQGTVTDLEKNIIAAAEGRVGASEVPNIFAAYSDTAYEIDKKGLVVDLGQYLNEDEISSFIDSYIEEGRFYNDGGIKIFPVAKSVELFMLNKTDWDKFAKATGASYDDLATVEGLVKVAEQYYNWTDAQTEEIGDGKAFFGRDAMANYMIIGAKQLGNEIFSVNDGKLNVHLDKEVARKLWDNYYVPFVKGYFAASGKFRSDDVKMGNVICFVGSSSGATFFPNEVTINDSEKYHIEVEVLPNPKFEDGENYSVQQGAGMVVTKESEAEIQASVEFLKWFTETSQNIKFSIDSGYLPVTKEANNIDSIYKCSDEIDDNMKDILEVAIDTVNNNKLYTPKSFEGGTDARSLLENSMSDAAKRDRQTVVERIAEGVSPKDAAAEFLTDENFEIWYSDIVEKLQQCK